MNDCRFAYQSVSPASPTKELEVYKKTVSREKARAEAEHARQLATLKHLVETLTETLTNKEQEIQALTSRVQTVRQQERNLASDFLVHSLQR